MSNTNKRITDDRIAEIINKGVKEMPSNPASRGHSQEEIRKYFYVPEEEILKEMQGLEEDLTDKINKVLTEEEKSKIGLLEQKGNGDKYLANDGTYKEVESAIVDRELSTESENLVQNKVITEALNGKVNSGTESTGQYAYIRHNGQNTTRGMLGELREDRSNIDGFFPTYKVLDNVGQLTTGTPTRDFSCANKQYVDEKFNGANKAVSFLNYSAMANKLNAANEWDYDNGQNIFIVTLEVPDLWVSSVRAPSVEYTYTSDEDFVNALKTNGSVQVGYFVLSALETQKVDLTEYATKEALSGKVSKSDVTYRALYGRYNSQDTTMPMANATADATINLNGCIPFYAYDSNGNHLRVNTPTIDVDVANKKYVDDEIAKVNTGSGGSSGSSSKLYKHTVIFNAKYTDIDMQEELGELTFKLVMLSTQSTPVTYSSIWFNRPENCIVVDCECAEMGTFSTGYVGYDFMELKFFQKKDYLYNDSEFTMDSEIGSGWGGMIAGMSVDFNSPQVIGTTVEEL